MARPKANPQPQSEDTPQASLQEPQGPAIEYIGDGAEKVKFTVNPKAAHYKVFAIGQVVETL